MEVVIFTVTIGHFGSVHVAGPEGQYASFQAGSHRTITGARDKFGAPKVLNARVLKLNLRLSPALRRKRPGFCIEIQDARGLFDALTPGEVAANMRRARSIVSRSPNFLARCF